MLSKLTIERISPDAVGLQNWLDSLLLRAMSAQLEATARDAGKVRA